MSYIRFMNDPQIAEFLSALTEQPRENPDRRQRGPSSHPQGSWGGPHWGWSPFDAGEESGERGPWSREMPHRHRHWGHGPHGRHHHHGPPPPPGAGDHPHPPHPSGGDGAVTPPEDGEINMVDNDDGQVSDPEISAPPAEKKDEAESSSSDEDDNGEQRGPEGRRHGRHGWGGRGGRCGRGGPGHGGFGHHRHGGSRGPWGAGRGPYGVPPHFHHHGGPHGGWGGRGGRGGRRGPPPFGQPENPIAHFAGMFGMDPSSFDNERLRGAATEFLSNMFGAANTAEAGRRERSTTVRGDDGNDAANNRDVDFRPLADIYDAKDEYIVHFVLPGAKKQDISLNWDAEHGELHITGVIAREGDEETIQALALAERDVGIFERRVKLGREGVDAESISAKMENGLLVVRIPKRVDDEWTEVKKVDIA